jgi:hypothetical protein
MICCQRTKRRQINRHPPAMFGDGHRGTAIGVALAARISFARIFCAAAAVLKSNEEDPSMSIPPELEAQILRYYHVEKCPAMLRHRLFPAKKEGAIRRRPAPSPPN